MILHETITSFLQEIINFPDFKLSTFALQQQIQHLLFLVNIADCCSDINTVIEEHNKLLDFIKTGDISWDNVDYLNQWQSKILDHAKLSGEFDIDNNDCDISEKLLDTSEHASSKGDEDKVISNKGEIEGNPFFISIKKPSEKFRVRRSSVHGHFKKVRIFFPTTNKSSFGSICKHCKAKFTNRISTNLKLHLKSKHPEAFDQVQRFDGDESSRVQRHTGTNLINNSDADAGATEVDREDNAKKMKIWLRHSAVHEYFHKVDILHPVSKKPVQGAVCKLCKAKFSNRVSTNLKSHLLARTLLLYLMK